MQRLILLSILLALAADGARLPSSSVHAQADPCAAAMAAEPAVTRAPASRGRKYGPLGADDRDIRELLQVSAAAKARALALSEVEGRAATAGAVPAADRDDNNIAILEDTNGELIIRANPFDLANRGVRFEPAGGGYSVSSTSAAFHATLGRRLTLGDDDSTAQTLAAPFEFYGRRFSSLFVNSDGNLTFEAADSESTSRSLNRVATGAPRIAAFFADLDPSAGGRVFFNSAADLTTVTWCAVPGYDAPETVNVQAALLSSGAIEVRFGAVTLTDGIVALSPGHVDTVISINLNSAAGAPGGPVAFGEQFTAAPSLDLIAASRRFYASHPDNFDQLVFFTDTPVMIEAFAFETTVKNAITGTGLELFDFSAELGSAGALTSLVNMDFIQKYPDAPATKLFGEFSALGILAHETGHRWLSRIMFRDANRAVSDQLLGRQLAHWSFFLDSDGSVMEGNEIEDLGGGSFRTTAATEKYSRLDLYAMGLANESEVPRFFYIDVPVSSYDREDGPLVGATITGTRRDVLIQDVVDALGPRVPAAADSPRVHRQAYVFVRRASAVLDQADLRRLTRMREEFGAFFSRATENRMTVRTTLAP